MMPYIITIFGAIPTFPLCVALGILFMFWVLHLILKKSVEPKKEESFIFPKIVICLTVAFLFAALFDAFFKFLKYGQFKIKGITFYGGLFGAILSLYIQLKIAKKREFSQYSISEWFDILTLSVLSFHFWGRIGCFLGGCCYGKITTSIFGVIFPDNPLNNIVHDGVKRYPTQLFEAVALAIIFFIVLFRKKKFQTYLLFYAIVRFLLEFFRGDDRGTFTYLSPAQIISIIILLILLLYNVKQLLKKANCRER